MITDRRLRWVLWAAVVVPFVTAAVRALATDWFPIGDSALLYLRSMDVGTRHHPLLGSWSSASLSLGRNINNPGPIYDDLVAPFARLLPVGPGNVVGVSVVNLASITLAALAARRIGGPRHEAWTLVTAAALAWTLGSEVLFDMFQAHALLFPFLCALVLLTGAMTGHRWCWPWLVLVWSVILQTHVSYAYIAVALVGTAVVAAVVWAPRPLGTWLRGLGRAPATWWSVGVAAAVWIQPVIEQLTGEGEGNLSRLAASAGGTDVSVGLPNAFRMVSAVFALPPWWTRWGFAHTIEPAGLVDTADGGRRVDIPWLPNPVLATVAFLVLLVLLVVAARWARAHGRRVLLATDVVAIAGLVGAVLALSRLTVGEVGLAAHHTRWMFVLALWCHAALGATALAALLASPRARSAAFVPTWSRVGALGAAVAVALGVANLPAYTLRQGPLADTRVMPALRRVFDDLDRLDELDDVTPIRYETDNLVVYEPYSSAVMAQLVERGIEFRVRDEGMVRQLGPERRASGDERVTVTQYQGWEALRDDHPGCVLVRVSDVGAGEEERLAGVAADLERRAVALDVGRVPGADGTTEADADLARSVIDGDPVAIRRAVIEGWYASWAAAGLVDGDPALVADLVSERAALFTWAVSSYSLVLTPADAC